ncbi:hypothetical protein [Parahaliea aestuarii]|uniref:DUF4148 domain-containing protein n=1 Tax=Parahaliea aestuarii TaxID=1852021 RepID=A0A5C8ZWS2_9GAMM|nr:hypothetical protein [Parahaliea aestuarii]TXS92309.1 hypothetical protein FVW59_07740 [Parahaliea aestuarii]
MKVRSVLALLVFAVAPIANAQSVDQVLVRAAQAAKVEMAEEAAQEAPAGDQDIAKLETKVELVAADLDQVLDQRFDRGGDIPRPSEAMLVSN